MLGGRRGSHSWPPHLDDHVLRVILAVTLLSTGFWLWFRVPNFASPDEYSRLVRPMKVAGWTLADPGLGSLRQGILDGRALGATTYLYALVLVPIGAYVVFTGRVDAFASFGELESRWELWFAAPEWFWTASILLARVVVLLLALGCVYVTYLLGRRLRDRTTGRLAALLLALSLGFVGTAHEAGEDLPMLFVLLLALLYVLRYAEDGRRRTLLVASALGGLAIAFKLTAGVVALAIGGALVARLHREGTFDRDLVVDAAAGLIVGVAAIVVGMPSVLLGGPEHLVVRVFGAGVQKVVTTTSDPVWFWIVRQYVNGLGLPLAAAAAVGVLAALRRVPERIADGQYDLALLCGALVVYLAAFSLWGYVRIHHLLPTFPLLALLLANEVSIRHRTIGWNAVTVAVALLVATTVLYTAIGVTYYANEPRDQATEWLDEHAADDATVEVYEDSIADVGVPHDQSVSQYEYQEETKPYFGSLVENESAYTEWMLALPERQPEYVQLTSEELRYLDDRGDEYPERRAHVEALLEEEYDYTVVGTYGPGEADEDGVSRIAREAVRPVPGTIEPRVVLFAREDE